MADRMWFCDNSDIAISKLGGGGEEQLFYPSIVTSVLTGDTWHTFQTILLTLFSLSPLFLIFFWHGVWSVKALQYQIHVILFMLCFY